MAYSNDVINRVIEENDIVDVISEYVSLKKSGKDFKGLCPFHHEKTPSFSVSQEKQLYHCFGCNAGGNVITFVMDIENISFIEAVEMLAERAGIKIEQSNLTEAEYKKKKLKEEIFNINRLAAIYFYKNLRSKKGRLAFDYLIRRGLNENTIKAFGLGYADTDEDSLVRYFKDNNYNEEILLKAGLALKKGNRCLDRFNGRVIFPIIDDKNNILGFGGRVLDNSLPKYINSPETEIFKKSKILYGLNFAKKSNNESFIVVEGYMDVIALHQVGIDSAVASLGTALTAEQGKLIKKYKEKVIISYDADEAGLNATLRGLDILDELDLEVRVLRIPSEKDPDEFIKKEGLDSFNKLLNNSTDSLIEFKSKIYLKDLNLDNPEDKIKYIRRIIKDIARITDKIKRDVYISASAKIAQIPENTIRSEIDGFVNRSRSKIEKNRYTVGKNRHNNIYSSENFISPEKYLIALLLYDNNLYKDFKSIINKELIVNDKLKPIFQVLIETLENDNNVNLNNISHLMENQELKDEFGDIIKILYETNDIKPKIVYDVINKINFNNLVKKRNKIKEEINKAYIEGNIEKERMLLKDLQICEKEMLKIKNG
ncbi:MAG: DNA primase [Thermoanaerobacteraceae bacterium]